ncbi:GDP-mannose 4,6-dehydratase [Haloflavibacter putidus]|uniref:NAD-dependent epimerase/dehydratase family protein n=1 Tax=Haloflavibacter putidus TaxID=2576776 RepID=A0A507Z9T4_9FLAO|nr:NAD-dependent epimerase/dehydratase family protein [Haloflavibacter putidus]TQD33819.1 NAD-dependent epimerase/dehydratase family protein [Haloflavibacter putidus]
MNLEQFNQLKDNKILVTGAAGFIGFHLCRQLLEQGYSLIGLDNLNNYYDVGLKFDRLAELGIEKDDASYYNKLCTSSKHANFQFIQLKIEDRVQLPKLFQQHNFDKVCNLAAQAGVRYSIENPEVYADSNISGFLNLLECMRHNEVKKLVYASSSSVYGNNKKVPFAETDNVDEPISVYAATKKSNELMAHTYSHLYGIECIGLRFFTVYGPWGRPDMALFLFTDAILKDKPIKVFNHGDLSRDFTFIDDIITGVVNTLEKSLPNKSLHEVYNIGNSSPVQLIDFIKAIEEATRREAKKEMLPMQPGDVATTYADVSKLKRDFNYAPNTKVKEGIRSFVEWYKGYYGV